MMAGVKTAGHKKALMKQLNPVCGICLLPIEDIEKATVDHIIPLALGGSNHRTNVQLAHDNCNRKKGSNPAYIPISLRKKRCPSCHRWFTPAGLKSHKRAKHQDNNLAVAP